MRDSNFRLRLLLFYYLMYRPRHRAARVGRLTQHASVCCRPRHRAGRVGRVRRPRGPYITRLNIARFLCFKMATTTIVIWNVLSEGPKPRRCWVQTTCACGMVPGAIHVSDPERNQLTPHSIYSWDQSHNHVSIPEYKYVNPV